MSILQPDPKSTRIRMLLRELEHKNDYIQTLRARLPTNQRGSQRLERAIRDAHTLLVEAFRTGQSGRDSMLKETGMTRSAWQWAVAFLRLANIVKRNESARDHKWQKGLLFLITDRDAAFAQLNKVALELDTRPDAYTLLRKVWYYGYLPQAEVDAPGYVHGRAKGKPGQRPG